MHPMEMSEDQWIGLFKQLPNCKLMEIITICNSIIVKRIPEEILELHEIVNSKEEVVNNA